MQSFFEQIKHQFGKIKIELLVMLLFLISFAVLKGPELRNQIHGEVTTEDAPVTAEEPDEADVTEETESEKESESELPDEITPAELTDQETEQETEFCESAALIQKKRYTEVCFGPDFEVPMRVKEVSVYGEGSRGIYQLQEWNMLSAFHMLLKHEKQDDRPLSQLQTILEKTVETYDGDWAVYVKRLDTGEEVLVNDVPMKSASVMKLFIMGAVYKKMENGELERTDEIQSLLEKMISASDNESSNKLLYILGDSNYEDGIAIVDEFIEEYGFSNMTVEYNGFNNSATVTDSNKYNQVAAKDCGRLLELVYRRELVNRSASNEIEQMMLNQSTRYKIPKGLPDGVLCGNKTGEMDKTENDAAIIYSPNCDYILVVLSSDWASKDAAQSRIASISKETYSFLN